MLKFYCSFVVAFGLTVLASIVNAQELPNPAIESRPVSEIGQEQNIATSENPATHTGPIAIEIGPSLQRVQSAISLLIPEEDEQERQRKFNQDVRDLNAQEEMAFWARGMFWATIGSVGISFVGLVLIGFTLNYTRRAAEASDLMVIEARNTTKAAQDAITENRDIGRKQTRAYLTCLGASYKWVGNSIEVLLNLKNVGQSPAVGCLIGTTICVTYIDDVLADSVIIHQGINATLEGQRIASSEVFEIEETWTTSKLEPPINADIDKRFVQVINLQAQIAWTDVFGEEQRIVAEMTADLRGSAGNGERSSIRWLAVNWQSDWYDKFEYEKENG